MRTRKQFDTGVDGQRNSTAPGMAEPGRPGRSRIRSLATRGLAVVFLVAFAALLALPQQAQAQAVPVVTIAADQTSVMYRDSGDADTDGVTNGTVSFTLTRTGATTGTLMVAVTLTQDRSFLGSADLSEEVMFATGSATKVLTILDTDFTGFPAGEVVASGNLRATVAAGTGYAVGTPATASVSIVIALTVGFDMDDYRITEESGSLQIKLVARTGEDAPKPTTVIYVSVSTQHATPADATSPADYGGVSTAVSIPVANYMVDGSVFKAEVTVAVPIVIVNDEVVEGDEAFEIRLEITSGLNKKYSNWVLLSGESCLVSGQCDRPVTIVDDDDPIELDVKTFLDTTESSDPGLEIRLKSEIGSDVIVNMVSSDTGAFTVSPASFTFKARNWSRNQELDIIPVQDADTNDEMVMLTLSGATSGSNPVVEVTVDVVILDDDLLLTLPESPVAVNEGEEVTFEVALASAPGHERGVLLESDDPEAVTVHPGWLTFTTMDWATAQTVTVTGVADGDELDEQVTITLWGAGVKTGMVTVDVTDDDFLSVKVSRTTLTVTEEDTTGNTYTVVLGTQPTASVVVTVAGHAGTDVTPAPASLTFTTLNWDTAQTVMVTAANDANTTDDMVSLTHTAASSDGDYDGIGIAGLTVTVNDNDTAQVTGLMIEPGNAQLAVQWARVANATGYEVQWKSGGQNYNNIRRATIGSGSTTSHTISSLNNGTAYTVRVRATRTGANDGAYSAEVMETPVMLTAAGVTVSESALTVTEEDSTGDSYTVVLDSQPSANVVITVAGHAGTDVTPTPVSLTFTTGNWQTAQTVTVTAGDDADTADETVSLSHSAASSDGDYGGITIAGVTVTVEDNDTAPPIITTPPVIGGGGGGGGGGGPSPSTVDFEWTVKHDIEELDGGHGSPTGLWSDGTTMWIAENGDGADDAIYAYDLTTGERVEEREFQLAETNRAPRGVWSDRTVIWISDSGQDKLFAHDLASGDRLPDSDLALHDDNDDPRGIWSDEVTMWVLDGVKDRLYAYDLASGELVAEYALDSTNGDPRGIWSDGVTVWVSDHGAKRLFAYRLPARPEVPAAEDTEAQDLERVAEEEFGQLSGASNNSPRGIWANGDFMYVVDASDGKVYTYNMPDAIDARLATLTLSGVDIGEFLPRRTDYEGDIAEGVTETTVEAATVQRRTAIAIDPPDADGDEANGHQVALEGVSEITVTVTSADGSRERVYRIAFTQALAEFTLDTGWNTFAWPGAGGAAIADALGGDGDLANDISAAVAALYGWDEEAGAWLAFFPGLGDVPGVNTLAALEQGHAYWIAVTEPVTWTVPALTTVAEVEVEATARATAFAGTVTDPAGEADAGLAVEAYVGDTRCNAGEPVATYRALEDGGEVTRYYASVAHADQLAGCAATGGDVTFRIGDRAVVETGTWDNAAYPWQTLDLTLARETATEETVTIDVAVWRQNEDPFNALAALYISTRAPGESWITHDGDGALAMTLYTSPRSGAQNWYRSELTPVEVVLADGSTVTIDVAVWRNAGTPTSLYISTRVPGEGWITHDEDGALAMTLYTSPRSGAQNWYRSDLTPIEVALQ